MLKRIIASAVGVLAVLASVIALGYAIAVVEDFTNPAVPLRFALLGEFLMCSIALAALGMGIRFLRFAWRGRIERSEGWLRPVLLGIGFFFPGFLFSLPFTILWARHTWPGDGQSVFAALEISEYIGVAAAIICCVVLLKKRRPREIHEANGGINPPLHS